MALEIGNLFPVTNNSLNYSAGLTNFTYAPILFLIYTLHNGLRGMSGELVHALKTG